MRTSPLSLARTEAVGVVLPVHDEERLIEAALRALRAAVDHPDLTGVACRVAIVLDACQDGSGAIVRQWSSAMRGADGAERVLVVDSDAANVGAARRAGCAALLRSWADIDPRRIWLATSDADSEVPEDWLALQVARHEQGVDLWTGSVTVLDWSHRRAELARAWRSLYDAEVAPTHGTSLGLNAGCYLEAGGFEAVCTGEDRALHRAVVAVGAAAHHDRSVPVVTSARRDARAPMGFARALTSLERVLRRQRATGGASGARGEGCEEVA
ncbi:MAG: glycosyl transferase [Acidimicrobiaceae bacterium]|jgi:hypothetical protein|nr:glycosyl transferase [Acidimicrobiaceae bacterium]